MDGTIASAVMLPEPESQDVDGQQLSPSLSGGQKRRQSLVSEQEPKRARVNSVVSNASADKTSAVSGPALSTTGSRQRERGRERRLFGAVLGALSQTPAHATAGQKKRAEVEKRQKARRELEEQEYDQRKLERDSQRKAQRQIEQKRFEEESMRIRHANLRNMAHFLQTDAEPRLYYKPWELTADQEDRIKAQIAEAENITRRELKEKGVTQDAEGKRERQLSRNTDAERDAGANPPTGKEPIADAPRQQIITGNGYTNDSGPSPKDLEQREDHAVDSTSQAVSGDQAAEPENHITPASHTPAVGEQASKEMVEDNGEEVVEAAEDTVIY